MKHKNMILKLSLFAGIAIGCAQPIPVSSEDIKLGSTICSSLGSDVLLIGVFDRYRIDHAFQIECGKNCVRHAEHVGPTQCKERWGISVWSRN